MHKYSEIQVHKYVIWILKGNITMSQVIAIVLPDGEYCMRDARKPCVFARYTKKWDAYNCIIHNKILKGG